MNETNTIPKPELLFPCNQSDVDIHRDWNYYVVFLEDKIYRQRLQIDKLKERNNFIQSAYDDIARININK